MTTWNILRIHDGRTAPPGSLTPLQQHLVMLGIDSRCPVEARTVRKGIARRPVEIWAPVFPGYLFAVWSVETQGKLREWAGRYAGGWVTANGALATVSDAVLDAYEGGDDEPIKALFPPGTKVALTNDPMALNQFDVVASEGDEVVLEWENGRMTAHARNLRKVG